MISKKVAEEQVYFPIVSQFGEKDIDYEFIGKIIVDACNAIDDENQDVDPKAIVKNALLLILGLIHKNEPVDKLGKDISSLGPDEVRRIEDDLKSAFG
nr:hypothetical protein [Candidatus Sigynarchaeota archaeon]